MTENNYKIKLSFIDGIGEIVEEEIKRKTKQEILAKSKGVIYVNYKKSFTEIINLKSIHSASLTIDDVKYNPGHISRHKNILGEMIRIVVNSHPQNFKTFRISCAGSDSTEVKSLNKYIEDEFNLSKKEDADLKINIYKKDLGWEISIQITPRPLSLREYKTENMSGAMDSNLAYALNSFCKLENKKSYLNPFCGSGTLLIEAGLNFNNLENLTGFDNNKKHLSFAYRNTTKAGLIKKVKLIEHDIFEDLEDLRFDVIVSDLPFGMTISKGENLNILYKRFLDFSEKHLNTDGVLGVYTTEHETFIECLRDSQFQIIKQIDLKLVSNVNSYLYPKIIICSR